MEYTKSYIEDIESIFNSGMTFEGIDRKSILITGASGLICSAIVDLIIYANEERNANIQIYLAGRNIESLKKRFLKYCDSNYLNFLEYDATQPIKFDVDVDYIIHGASNAQPNAYISEPIETMRANFLGMDNLLSYAYNHQCKRTLYISSSEVYGKKEDNRPYLEESYGYVDILNPRACYPISKRAGETLCSCYHQQYGLDIVIARPGHIYGPTSTANDNRATAQFANDVLSKKNIVMKTPGTQMRSYCHVLDCASAILTILVSGKSGEAYNISNSHSIVTIRQVAEEYAKSEGCKIIFQKPSDSERKSYNLMDNSSLNATKLESLGWKAIFDIELGVHRTLLVLKEQRANLKTVFKI